MAGTVPDDDSIAAILHKIRPFVLRKEEPVSFFRTRNLLAKHLRCPQMQRSLEQQRDLFSGKDFEARLRITSSGPDVEGILNTDEAFHKWLNAYEYHRDADKRMEIQNLCGALPFEIGRAIFISMLVDKIRAILNIAKIIRCCESADGIPVQI